MTVKYAVIGCGKHALRNHMLPEVNGGMKLVAVCDTQPQCAQAALGRVGVSVPQYTSALQLLEESEAELVIIATPDQYHALQFVQVVESGRHVLVDKPLAAVPADLPMVQRALHTAVRDGLQVFGCHPRRFSAPYRWVKEQLPEWQERFGPLVQVQLDFSYHEPNKAWKHERSLALDHLSHELDYLRWLLGEAEFQMYLLQDGFDRYSVAGSWGTGVSFSFLGTRRLTGDLFPEQINLRFERGQCSVHTKAGRTWLYDHERQNWAQWGSAITNYTVQAAELMNNVAETLSGQAKNYLTPQELWLNTEVPIHVIENGFHHYVPGR